MSQLTAKTKVEYVPVMYDELGTKVYEFEGYDTHDGAVESASNRLSFQIKNSGYQYFYIVIEERIVPIYE